MKNLHNWALISEDAALLAADLPNVVHRLRKYREAGETIEACFACVRRNHRAVCDIP